MESNCLVVLVIMACANFLIMAVLSVTAFSFAGRLKAILQSHNLSEHEKVLAVKDLVGLVD